MDHSTEMDKLGSALALAQGAIEGAVKDHKNPFFNSKYADLASVWGAVRQALVDNGLSVTQTFEPASVPGELRITTTLLHSSGQWLGGTLSLWAMRQPKGKPWEPSQDPQSIGSAITYGRRYALAALLGVIQEDDDGEKAMHRPAAGDHSAGALPQPSRPAQPADPSPGSNELAPPGSPLAELTNAEKQRGIKRVQDAMGVVKSVAATWIADEWKRGSDADAMSTAWDLEKTLRRLLRRKWADASANAPEAAEKVLAGEKVTEDTTSEYLAAALVALRG